jgi:uncharacterized membrane protein
MKKKSAFIFILIISIAGLLFSGYLSYGELFASSCYATQLGMGNCTNVFTIPACVYGFVMYLVVFVISIIGLRGKN